jgi:asparagine synthetase B (glutamine-hydrolysing)
MLSGGLDSRTVTAEAVALGANPLAITFGSPDSADVKLAVRVAKILDLEHLVIQLDARSVADSIEEAVLVTGGTTSAAHLTGHASNRQLADAVDVVLSGMAGDGITGKVPPDLPAIPQKAIHPLLPTQSIIMPEAFRAATGEPYEQSLEVDIAAYPEGTSPIIISTFEALRCRWRRFTLSGVVSRRLDTSVQFPFFRQQLLDTAFALAPEQRLHQAAYAANFTSRHPRCAAVPWERTGRPISRGARQPSLAFRMARGLRARIAAALKGGRVARQTGHFDYAAELRRPGPLREMIADLLTDGTASTRPWLDADGVSRLLERHFAGMANNLAPLARALTLELFLRRVRQPAVPDSA